MDLDTAFTFPPSVHQHIAARINEKENFQAVDVFYYLPEGIASYLNVATGNLFAVVHSPSVYALPSTLFYGQWTVTLYKVFYHKFPKVDKEATRYYRDVGTRALSSEETAYFEGLKGQANEATVRI